MNFELYNDGTLIAETEMMNDDYLTFMVDGGFEVEEGQTENFTVRADVVEGAGDRITFTVDQRLDVMADSDKFGFGSAVNIQDVDGDGTLRNGNQ